MSPALYRIFLQPKKNRTSTTRSLSSGNFSCCFAPYSAIGVRVGVRVGAFVDLIVGTLVLPDGGLVDLILGTMVLADGGLVDLI